MRVKNEHIDKINGYDLNELKEMYRRGEITYCEYEEYKEEILQNERWRYLEERVWNNKNNDYEFQYDYEDYNEYEYEDLDN